MTDYKPRFLMPSYHMTAFRSEFMQTLEARGFIHQSTHLEALDAAAASSVITGYIGFDATADSLHVGHLTQIMTLYWLQQTGHKPIALMGGGTTKVGDPTGKDKQRQMLTDADIEANIAAIKKSFAPFLTFGDGPGDAIMVNNDDWLSKLSYVDFLRDFGIHFTINRMLTFDSVKLRLEREQPMSFLEFNYMLMQAYDFYELNERYGCTLQLGGSDQWGNIVNGVELCRRVAAASDDEKSRDVIGLTTPLLMTASGKKMGKTESGAVWLNPNRLSPYDYWQYWRNVDDADVGILLKRFTALPLDEVDRLGALGGSEINEAKKVLASEVTRMLHGDAAAESAAETARKTFEQGGAAGDLPTISITNEHLLSGLALLDAAQQLGLIASKSEGRRHLKAGALKINGAAAPDEGPLLADQVEDGQIKLSVGKKRHGIVQIGETS